ncbi:MULTISPECIES: DoxX family protein [Actinomadura]|uniref:DoxX family protein n=1 Tax=Actinomadura yumaensis TaxID=111807 RepID=A0ABW2CN19_9ACTN|nr:DoxX family protein [Actinomadura sp. J1-007]MWK38713.1 DoxX family membrane protein [Actinomadura sp. J1-007]
MLPARRFPYLPDAGLLLGRLALGVIFVAHGWQKLTDVGHSGVTKMFEGMDIPFPALSATYATWVELVGGIALILGVVVPVAGILLALDMAGALWFAHIDHGLFADKGGYELVLILGAASLLLAFTGAGRLSLDSVLWDRRTDARSADGSRTAVDA